MFVGQLIISLEKKFMLTRRQVAAIINEEEINIQKYAHLKVLELTEHEKSIKLMRIVTLWDLLQNLVKLSPWKSDVRKTLFQRFQLPSGQVVNLINLIQEDKVNAEFIQLALKAQRLGLNTYHAPELFSKAS